MQLVVSQRRWKIMTMNSERTFAIRVSTSHFTVLVDQQASSKELRLNNFLMDVMYRSASRHQEAKQKEIEFPEMDCGDISDEVSEQVVYWMKNANSHWKFYH